MRSNRYYVYNSRLDKKCIETSFEGMHLSFTKLHMQVTLWISVPSKRFVLILASCHMLCYIFQLLILGGEKSTSSSKDVEDFVKSSKWFSVHIKEIQIIMIICFPLMN